MYPPTVNNQYLDVVSKYDYLGHKIQTGKENLLKSQEEASPEQIGCIIKFCEFLVNLKR